MLIEYTGPKTRIRLVAGHTWSRDNGYSQDVDAGLAAVLLTEPGDDFRVHPDEPLLALEGGSQEMAGRLALAGIGSLEQLQELSEPQLAMLGAVTDLVFALTPATPGQPASGLSVATIAAKKPRAAKKPKPGGKP